MLAVMQRGLILVLIGLVIGLVGAFALTRLISGLLFGIEPADPPTFGVVAALVFAVAMVACYIPARRATRLDPSAALRCER